MGVEIIVLKASCPPGCDGSPHGNPECNKCGDVHRRTVAGVERCITCGVESPQPQGMSYPTLRAVCFGMTEGEPIVVHFKDGVTALGEFQCLDDAHGGCIVVEMQQGTERWDAFYAAEDVSRVTRQAPQEEALF